VSRYQKGKTNLDFTEARDSGWQWHQLGYMQVCTLLQTDNHTSTPPLISKEKVQKKRISRDAYDINKQTIYTGTKSKIEPRAHYTPEPARGTGQHATTYKTKGITVYTTHNNSKYHCT